MTAGEQFLTDSGVLLAAEQARLTRELCAYHEVSVLSAQRVANVELESAVRRLDVSRVRLSSATFEQARKAAMRAVEQFRAELEPFGSTLYRRAVTRFVELANETLGTLRVKGGLALKTPPAWLECGPELRAKSELYYTNMMHLTWSPVGGCDRFPAGSGQRGERGSRRAAPYLEHLVEANCSRVANDMMKRVAGSRAQLEVDLRSALTQVIARAERALSKAQALRAEGEEATGGELLRIAELREEVSALL